MSEASDIPPQHGWASSKDGQCGVIMEEVGVTNFVRRQTRQSPFSHFDGSFEQVVELAKAALAEGTWQTSAKTDNVLEVRVPAEGFYSAMVKVEAGAVGEAVFEQRAGATEPEAPAWQVRVPGKKLAAKQVTLILYSSANLGEKHATLPLVEGNWELVSINAELFDEHAPIMPDALMRNHFGWPGGTAMGLTDEEFVGALKRSVAHWRAFAHVKGEEG
ncbi:MAG: DUF3228 family protein [bacterium]|nr:DUF3228 family protein [bacterium]